MASHFSVVPRSGAVLLDESYDRRFVDQAARLTPPSLLKLSPLHSALTYCS